MAIAIQKQKENSFCFCIMFILVTGMMPAFACLRQNHTLVVCFSMLILILRQAQAVVFPVAIPILAHKIADEFSSAIFLFQQNKN